MDHHLDPDRLQSILEGGERLRPGDTPTADALEQVAAVRTLRLPSTPADAHARLQRQIETLTATPTSSRPWWMLGSWFGAGPFPRPLAQRVAAGALMLAAAGSGASVATGIAPAELASRIGDFGGALIANLGPGGSGFIAAAGPGADESATAVAMSPVPSQSPDGSSQAAAATPLAGTQMTSGAGVSSTPEPSTTPVAGAGQPVNNQATGTVSPAATLAGSTPVLGATLAPTSPPSLPATQGPGTSTPAPLTATIAIAPSPTATPPVPSPTSSPVVPTPTNAPTAAPTPSPTTSPAPDQVQTYSVAEAGSVTLRLSGGSLTIVTISPAAGWTATIDEQSPPEIDFRSGDQRWRFSAQVEDGSIRTSVEAR